MRPLQIEMKGFGAFREHTQVDLTDIELVALVGATGSGKSTIIDAITFALYGSIARYDDNRQVALIVNQLSPEARVSLTFELNGAEYVAVRVVRRNTSGGASTREARLERGDTILADSARPMSGAVHQLLGLDVDQFNRTVVLPQGRFADFLHDEPAERQATLRQLLGLDIYQRIGQAARARSSRLGTQLELLRGELDDDSAELTDERRNELALNLTKIEGAHVDFATTRERHDELAGRVADLTTAITHAERDLDLLTSVTVPEGVDELAERERSTHAELQSVTEQLADVTRQRAEAKRAVDDGPDLTALTLQISLHEQLAAATARQSDIATQIEQLSRDADAATEAAATVRATQRELDSAVAVARDAEDAARAAAADRPSLDQLEVWAGLHTAHARADAELSEARAAVDRAEAPIAEHELHAATAHEHARSADAELSELRERHGVVAYAHLLAEGAPCPLCQHPVGQMPDHHLDAAITAAEAHRTEATERATAAAATLDAARQSVRDTQGTLRSATTAAERAAEAIAGIATPAEIETMRAEVTRLAEAAATARTTAAAAVQAAAAHRDEPANLAVLDRASELSAAIQERRGQLTTVAERVSELTTEVAGGASHDEAVDQREAATKLRAALDHADDLVAATDTERAAALTNSEAASAQARTARRDLSAARDRVASLGPPSIDDVDLAGGWAALATWRDERRQQRADERDAARASAGELTSAIDELTVDARNTASAATGSDAGEITINELGEFYAGHVSTARAALGQFDEAVAKLADARSRVEQLEADEAVARKLGQLLRADAFEAWLMQSALQQLVGRATERLFELSGGQYSLVVIDNQFLVCDHSNADETRSTRTLSGGETFLASLSLALALSEATAELAPEGAPQIESIFLDEGFGTLDPETLDTVATAIEELGASGRMVGIVTHIRELADRMPVRLEVTKAAGTATVERVEV